MRIIITLALLALIAGGMYIVAQPFLSNVVSNCVEVVYNSGLIDTVCH